jgi:hypothetical protein
MPFRTDEECKQVGILSSYLFNYFIDDLLTGLQNLGVGATVGNFNNSVMAYCDDILLLASNEAHMNKLLNFCYRYSCLWKMEFNPNKSLAYSSNNSPNTFVMNGIKIPQVKGFIYLGLPIGDKDFIEQYFSNKMAKVEKSLYSLRSLGCRKDLLNPKTISFIYKQFYQSTFKYGLENLHLSAAFLDKLNVRQNILLKNTLGIKYYARFKPLLSVLRVELINQLYYKHKMFGLRQFSLNQYINNLFNFLSSFYNNNCPPKKSFLSQIKESENFTGEQVERSNIKESIKRIDEKFSNNDIFLKELLADTINSFDYMNAHVGTNNLNALLYINFND